MGKDRPEPELYHSPPFSAEIMNECIYTSAYPACLYGLNRDKLHPLPSFLHFIRSLRWICFVFWKTFTGCLWNVHVSFSQQIVKVTTHLSEMHIHLYQTSRRHIGKGHTPRNFHPQNFKSLKVIQVCDLWISVPRLLLPVSSVCNNYVPSVGTHSGCIIGVLNLTMYSWVPMSKENCLN